MKKPDSLQIVLTVRLREEETEERALAAACAEVYQAETQLQTLLAACKQAQAEGLGEAGVLLHGTEVQRREQHLHSLRHGCDLARVTLADKLNTRAKHQAAYLEARRGREVLDTLLKQRARTEETQRQRREANRSNDLFLSRRRQTD